MEVSEWKKHIEIEREQKNEFFKFDYQSPISFEEKEKFKDLNYYSPDIKYRLELELFKHSNMETLKIEDTQGNERKFLKWGEFNFRIDNTDCKLQTYKSSPEEDRLFVPFRDATSGKETYGAGRYLDFEAGRHKISEGKWMLDFNEAYNPWCAYNANYACPFTPPENWLEIPIYAGEKNYSH